MRIFRLIFCCVAFAGCSSGGAASPPGPARNLPDSGTLTLAAAQRSASSFALEAAGTKYKVLHSFYFGADGVNPQAGLINVKGMLYGTTTYGGTYLLGTVFEISPSGSERVLYSFKGGMDGETPLAGLVAVNGTLYGTTSLGGANGYGTVFKVSTSGTESVLHSFAGGADGEYPLAGLIDVSGTLYGTTSAGAAGSNGGNGTVFAVSTAGAESVLHRFEGGADGANPQASLISIKGELYGTTATGGGGSGCHTGCGTVFEMSTSGTESVLYAFKGGFQGPDGAAPYAGLTVVNGTFYGTTSSGGSSGLGTVFAVSPSGTENVLHSFGVGNDGYEPNAALIAVNGMLYGTTLYGGSRSCVKGYGCGIVFKVSPSGAETVIHFGSKNGGASYNAPLLDVNGLLYGTTTIGGTGQEGTVFSMSP